MRARLFSTITGGFAGYILGWIWGNGIADQPVAWIFTTFLCAIVGLIAGFNPKLRDQVGALLGAVMGFYLGWVLKLWLLGDSPGGWGSVILIAGMFLGSDLGAEAMSRWPQQAEAILLNVLYSGFLGGFFIDYVLLDAILGWRTDHAVLNQAPILLICGVLGGLAGMLSFKQKE